MCPHTILLRVRTYSHTPTICIAHLPLLLLYGAQAAQVQGLLRGNTKPSIFLRLPGSSMLDPVCQVLTLLLSLLALLVQKYKNCNMPAIFLRLPGSSMRAPSLPGLGVPSWPGTLWGDIATAATNSNASTSDAGDMESCDMSV